MRKRTVWTALAAAAMVMQLVGTAGPSAAQTTPITFNFTPTSGPAGTKINITGSGCPHSATHECSACWRLRVAPIRGGARRTVR